MKPRYGSPEEAGMSAERIERVRLLAESWVKDGIHPALVVLAARRGVIVLHEAFGRLTPEPESPPLQRDSLFQLSSLTKPITATAVMQLVEDGLLGLNRPVQDYVPEFRGEGKEAVMVHHLLTHTSGLEDERVTAAVAAMRGPAGASPQVGPPAVGSERLLQIYSSPLLKTPGEEMAYNSSGYNLLGEIVRRVSGRPLAEHIHERIFAPLGMTDSFTPLPDIGRACVVRRPAAVPFASMFAESRWQRPASGAGGVFSTALDMATFGQMFLNGGRYGGARVLSPASVTEMTRNQIPGISADFIGEYFPEASWGLGWDVFGNKKAIRFGTLRSAGAFGHSGNGGTCLWVDPEYEIVGAYFSVVLTMAHGRPRWNADLFQNAVSAAVDD